MKYGKFVYYQKGKSYKGKSQITGKVLYSVIYCLFFNKPDDKQIGYIAGIPFTFDKSFKTKAQANKFLKDNGYDIIS